MVRTLEFEKEEENCDSCGSPKAKLGYHKCTPNDSSEKKCENCKTFPSKCLCGVCACHDSSDWEEGLWAEVMEDYVMTAELGHLARDEAKHKEEMRGHWERLKSYVRNLIQKEKDETAIWWSRQTRTETIKEVLAEIRNKELEEALASQKREIVEKIKDMQKEANRAGSLMQSKSGNWKKSKKRITGAKIALEEIIKILIEK